MIIWLASYPKSGNTLLRSILVSLIFNEKGNVDFNQLHHISNLPAGIFFEKFTSNYAKVKEISKYWIKAQEELNQNKKLKLFTITKIYYLLYIYYIITTTSIQQTKRGGILSLTYLRLFF